MKRITRNVAMTAASAAMLVSMVTASTTPLAHAGAANASVSLNWYMWSASPSEVAAWKADAASVTAKYPNIHINFLTDAWTNYWTKLGVEAASSTLPDIISLQCTRTGGFATSFLPLNSYIKSSKFDINSFDKGIVGALSYKGTVRALPYDFGPLVVYYNKAMFKKYNVPTPTLTWTYADFVKAAQMMTKGKDYGFAAGPAIDAWLPFALSAGGQYMDKSGNLTLTDPKLVNGFQEYAKLRYQYHASPLETATYNNNGAWMAGNIGMVVTGPWDMINFKNTVKFDFGIATIPSQNGKSISESCGSGFGIANTSKHPDEAWKAISTMTNAQNLQTLAADGRAFPARTAQQPVWYKNAVAGSQQVLTWQLSAGHSVPYTVTPNWNQVYNLSLQYGTAVVNGNQSASQALSIIQNVASNQ